MAGRFRLTVARESLDSPKFGESPEGTVHDSYGLDVHIVRNSGNFRAL
jgi:hypothetical protein